MHTQSPIDGQETLPAEVVATVADHEGVDPMALDPPLYEAIDPDALDSLFPSGANGQRGSPGRLTFTYNGYRVSVTSDGDVEIFDPDTS